MSRVWIRTERWVGPVHLWAMVKGAEESGKEVLGMEEIKNPDRLFKGPGTAAMSLPGSLKVCAQSR